MATQNNSKVGTVRHIRMLSNLVQPAKTANCALRRLYRLADRRGVPRSDVNLPLGTVGKPGTRRQLSTRKGLALFYNDGSWGPG